MVCEQSFQLLDGFEIPVRRVERQGEIIFRLAVLRIGLQLPSGSFRSLIKHVQSVVRNGQEKVDFRICRCSLKDLSKELGRLLVSSLLLVNESKPLQDFRIIGQSEQSLPVEFFSGGVVLRKIREVTLETGRDR